MLDSTQNSRSKKAVSFLRLLSYAAIAGIITGTFVTLFKYLALKAGDFTEKAFDYARNSPLYIIVIFAGLAVISFLIYLMVKKTPDIKGGGIPRAEGILRGLIHFNWLKTFIFTFLSGLLSFMGGLSLGTEGPSVMLGTAIGKGAAKFKPDVDRYIMTGAAGAGFSVATGAPLAGITFVLEEMHKRFSMFILTIVLCSVAFASTVAKLLSDALGMETSLLSFGAVAVIPLKYIWAAVVSGLVAGLISVAFNRSMDAMNKFFEIRLKKTSRFLKLFFVFAVTGIFGLVLPMTLGSGHHLINNIGAGQFAWYLMLGLLAAKILLIALAANSGATGGLFIPVLVVGAVTGGFVNGVLTQLGFSADYSKAIIIICMCATLAACMHAPVTAMVFVIESTGSVGNSLFFIAGILMAVAVMQLLKTESLNDIMLNKILRQQDGGKISKMVDIRLEVAPNSFLVGKSVRDILLPPNCVIKGTRRGHDDDTAMKMVKGGDKVFHGGDKVLMQVQTYDENATRAELINLFGSQPLN